ncbi:unnamed protein product [Durusdinium trenchii]|uniref:EF-hand domain-containing protein n=2 Tax=Durusdinium trenchii TaxID=1381693 RepID=A0ABP0M7X5_9DINO
MERPLVGKSAMSAGRAPFYVRYPKWTNVSLLLFYVTAGFAFLTIHEGLWPETAVYMIAQIITTIGYGDAVRPSPHAQAFLTVYVLAGALIFTNVASDAVDFMLRKTQRGVDRTLMRVLAKLRGQGDEQRVMLKHHPLGSSAILLGMCVFVWVYFFATYERCTCSYGTTRVPHCVDGLECPETGGYQSSVHEALYMAVITFSTVGFGDVAPKSKLGRTLGSVFMVLGVASLALLVSELFVVIDDHKNFHRKRVRCTLEVFQQIDRDKTGRISRNEFLRYMLVRQGKVDIDALDQLDQLFDEIDKNKNGKLSFEEIEGVMLD